MRDNRCVQYKFNVILEIHFHYALMDPAKHLFCIIISILHQLNNTYMYNV